MRTLKTVVVAVVLCAMFSPAMGLAKTEPPVASVPARQVVQTGVALAGGVASTANALNTGNTQSGQSSEASQYAQREQQSKDVQDFKGGAVYLYFGSGVVLALIIIILILL